MSRSIAWTLLILVVGPAVRAQETESLVDALATGEMPRAADAAVALAALGEPGRRAVERWLVPEEEGPVDPSVVARSVADLAADEYRVREEASRALLALGPSALPLLETALESVEDFEAKERLRHAISNLRDRLSAERTPRAVMLAILALVRIGSTESTPALLAVLADFRDLVARVADFGLRAIHGGGPAAPADGPSPVADWRSWLAGPRPDETAEVEVQPSFEAGGEIRGEAGSRSEFRTTMTGLDLGDGDRDRSASERVEFVDRIVSADPLDVRREVVEHEREGVDIATSSREGRVFRLRREAGQFRYEADGGADLPATLELGPLATYLLPPGESVTERFLRLGGPFPTVGDPAELRAEIPGRIVARGIDGAGRARFAVRAAFRYAFGEGAQGWHELWVQGELVYDPALGRVVAYRLGGPVVGYFETGLSGESNFRTEHEGWYEIWYEERR